MKSQYKCVLCNRIVEHEPDDQTRSTSGMRFWLTSKEVGAWPFRRKTVWKISRGEYFTVYDPAKREVVHNSFPPDALWFDSEEEALKAASKACAAVYSCCNEISRFEFVDPSEDGYLLREAMAEIDALTEVSG